MGNRVRVRIGELAVDSVSIKESLQQIVHWAKTEQKRSRIVVPVNAQLLHLASKDRRFVELTIASDLVLADGMSLIAASHLLGRTLPERIAGVDLLPQLCEEAARESIRVYFLGGRPGTAIKTAADLSKQFPRLEVIGTDCPPLGFESDPVESAAVAQRIAAAAPDLLFVGFGAPKQEYWMEDHAGELPVRVMVAVGGSFDLLSGVVPRAPRWMQQVGLEWVFRLGIEPRRLWKRYAIGNSYLLWVVLTQALGQLVHGNEDQKAKVTE